MMFSRDMEGKQPEQRSPEHRLDITVESPDQEKAGTVGNGANRKIGRSGCGDGGQKEAVGPHPVSQKAVKQLSGRIGDKVWLLYTSRCV